MADEKKLKGYHKIPHELFKIDKETRMKYIQNGKVPILNAFYEVMNDFQLENNVSYKYYAYQWRWHFSQVKEFLHHIGFKISTCQGIRKYALLKRINPIKSIKFPENIFGIINKIFDQKFDQKLTRSLTRKDIINSDSYKNFCPEDRPEVDQKSELNKIKEFNKKIYTYTNREFQKFWNFYLSWSKNNPNLAVSDISVKKAKNNYHALIKKEILTPEEILQLTEKYLLKCQVFQSKAKSPANFLDELFEQEARDMLQNFNIGDSLTLKNENLHIFFDFNKRNRFVFKFQDTTLTQDQVLKILKRELPGKSDNEIIELINSFRAYLNKFKHSGLVDVKQYFFDFLREEVE